MRTIFGLKFIAILAFAATAVNLALPSGHAQAPTAWPPVAPEELALKDNVLDPGSPAMILEYEVESDNNKSNETVYKRIKIFREGGKKFADVEIHYLEKFITVEGIRARVTSPSGKVEDFNGVIYDKEIVKAKGFVYNAETFTLPNVEVGSVIEYGYRLHWHSGIPDVFKNPASTSSPTPWPIPQRNGRFSRRFRCTTGGSCFIPSRRDTSPRTVVACQKTPSRPGFPTVQ